ncbi:22885_t:CDS:1, partial [Dentiscutata erythropus]
MSNNSNNSPTNTASNTTNPSKTSNTKTTNADISIYITNPPINSNNIANSSTLNNNNYFDYDSSDSIA